MTVSLIPKVSKDRSALTFRAIRWRTETNENGV